MYARLASTEYRSTIKTNLNSKYYICITKVNSRINPSIPGLTNLSPEIQGLEKSFGIDSPR